jgi:hypothetical protein
MVRATKELEPPEKRSEGEGGVWGEGEGDGGEEGGEGEEGEGERGGVGGEGVEEEEEGKLRTGVELRAVVVESGGGVEAVAVWAGGVESVGAGGTGVGGGGGVGAEGTEKSITPLGSVVAAWAVGATPRVTERRLRAVRREGAFMGGGGDREDGGEQQNLTGPGRERCGDRIQPAKLAVEGAFEDGAGGFDDCPGAVGLFAEGGKGNLTTTPQGIALVYCTQAGVIQTAEAKLVGRHIGAGEQ